VGGRGRCSMCWRARRRNSFTSLTNDFDLMTSVVSLSLGTEASFLTLRPEPVQTRCQGRDSPERARDAPRRWFSPRERTELRGISYALDDPGLRMNDPGRARQRHAACERRTWPS